MSPCPVCGNEIVSNDATCKYCGEPLADEPAGSAPAIAHRIVNIEHGRPLVETALRKMESELARARSERVRVVTLIHGYGSSGKGGRIRTECRKVLDQMIRQKTIHNAIAGEEFKKRTGPGKALLQRFPDLGHDCVSDFSNPGVTIVVI